MPDVKKNPKPTTKANSSDSSDAFDSYSDIDSKDKAKQIYPGRKYLIMPNLPWKKINLILILSIIHHFLSSYH